MKRRASSREVKIKSFGWRWRRAEKEQGASHGGLFIEFYVQSRISVQVSSYNEIKVCHMTTYVRADIYRERFRPDNVNGDASMGLSLAKDV